MNTLIAEVKPELLEKFDEEDKATFLLFEKAVLDKKEGYQERLFIISLQNLLFNYDSDDYYLEDIALPNGLRMLTCNDYANDSEEESTAEG